MTKPTISITALFLIVLLVGPPAAAEPDFAFQDGPALKERKALHQKILKAKEKGVGTKAYMQFLMGIEDRVKKGLDEEVILEQIKKIDDGLAKQIHETVSGLAPGQSAATMLKPRPVNAYLDKLEALLKKKFKPIGEAKQICVLTATIADDGKITAVEPNKRNTDNKERTAKAIKQIKSLTTFPKPPKGTRTVDLTISTPGDEISTSIKQDEINFGPYMAYVQRKIKERWFPPKAERSKRVGVYFSVSRGGATRGLKIIRSSGATVADNAALKAVHAAQPFPPLPEGSPPDVDIQFTFDYNFYRSRHINQQ